jgi:hypothetical protein
MSSSWLQTIKHAIFKVFSDRFTQEQTSRCVTRIHRVCSVISPDKVPQLLRYSLFWDFAWRTLLFIYRVSSFISECLSLKTEPIGFTETSVNNYQSTRHIPQGGRSLFAPPRKSETTQTIA